MSLTCTNTGNCHSVNVPVITHRAAGQGHWVGLTDSLINQGHHRLPRYIIGSAEALPILCVRYFWWEREREREREIDGSDVTIVALKLAMNLHFPLPKIRTICDELTLPCQKFALFVSPFTLPVSPFTERSPWWRWKLQWVHTFHCQNMLCKIGDELTLSLAKNSHNWRWAYTPLPKIRTFRFSLHTSRLSLHGEVTMVALKIAMSSHFPLPKYVFALRLCSPSFKRHEPRDEWSKTQDKWSNLAQSHFVLPIEKLNQINTKNYWK